MAEFMAMKQIVERWPAGLSFDERQAYYRYLLKEIKKFCNPNYEEQKDD